jgi:hypothetical protein
MTTDHDMIAFDTYKIKQIRTKVRCMLRKCKIKSLFNEVKEIL